MSGPSWDASRLRLEEAGSFSQKTRSDFLRQILSQRWECPPPQIAPPQHRCVQLYFRQVFIIFPALAPADGMSLRSSERHYSANGSGSLPMERNYLLKHPRKARYAGSARRTQGGGGQRAKSGVFSRSDEIFHGMFVGHKYSRTRLKSPP